MTGTTLGRPWRRRATLGACLGALAGGCTPPPVPEPPPPQVYRLTRKSSLEARLPRAKWALAIAEPTCEPTLDTNRIALVRDGLAVEYYARSVWADRVPSLVQGLLVQSFLASERITRVGTDRDQLRADFLLRSDLRAFQVKGSVVRVAMGVQLLSLPRRDSAGSISFEQEEPLPDTTVDTVGAAFDEALGKVTSKIVAWTLRAGSTISDADG